MACPTCDHTMQCLRDVIFWCPRCGTIADHGEGGMYERPKLVERCRKFEDTMTGHCAEHVYQWTKLGIAAAINTPENRK